MEILFFLLFFGVIILNAFKGNGKSKSTRANKYQYKKAAKFYADSDADSYSALPDAAARVNAARRAARTGSATAAKYKRVQERRRAEQNIANSGLWGSKHRQDKNRNRRTDWGVRGDSALFSPKMIGIIGGGLLTFYLILTVVMT